MFRGLFSPLLPVTFWKALFLYSFWDVRINVCVSVTSVYFIENPTLTPSSDKSSCLFVSTVLAPFLQTLFCNLQNQHCPYVRLAYATLSEGRLLSCIAFRTCLRSHSARNNVDWSWTNLRPPPEAIQVGSIPDRSQKSANVHIQFV